MPSRPQFPSLPVFAALAAACLGLSGCTVSRPDVGLGMGGGSYAANGATSGPEFFSTETYGVAASPRVALGARLPRGGGSEKIGLPYTVRGKTYYPTENPKPVQVGLASWYGAAFHGRLTANGEVYDMNHLTAAHKTMPLPSYARVTNTENGRSLIVRVNDRGPFANDRVIDLSKRAADLLGYTHGGTAKVKVEYAGRAPLDGQDDAFLLASVRGVPGWPGREQFDQPSRGFMIAMNGPTPIRGPVPTRGLDGITGSISSAPAVAAASSGDVQRVVLPSHIPVPGVRPAYAMQGVAVSAYASQRVADAFAPFPVAPPAPGWKQR